MFEDASALNGFETSIDDFRAAYLHEPYLGPPLFCTLPKEFEASVSLAPCAQGEEGDIRVETGRERLRLRGAEQIRTPGIRRSAQIMWPQLHRGSGFALE